MTTPNAENPVRRVVIHGLEVLCCEPTAPAPERPPILLVHGACHGAWCWSDNFLPFFAGRGWTTYAITLRGHHRGATKDEIQGCTLADYVRDVSVVADQLPVPPVLLGHSMGGMVVQRYLTGRSAPAAVLVASAPPRGALLSRGLRRHAPLLMRGVVRRSALAIFASADRCRTLFFSAGTPEQTVRDCADRLTEESNRAIIGLLGRGVRRSAPPDRTPMLVVAAREDALFSVAQAKRAAEFFGADTLVLDGMGHNLMMESGWPEAASAICSWLENTVPGDGALDEVARGYSR